MHAISSLLGSAILPVPLPAEHSNDDSSDNETRRNETKEIYNSNIAHVLLGPDVDTYGTEKVGKEKLWEHKDKLHCSNH